MIVTHRKRYISLLCLLALGGLIGCQSAPQPLSSESEQSKTAAETSAEKAANSSTQTQPDGSVSKAPDKDRATQDPIYPVLEPGQYCYDFNDEIQDVAARVTIGSADRVTGDLQGVVHNEAQGYFTSYKQTLDGTIDGSNLNLDVATWIEYDKQNDQEVWQVSPTELRAGKDTLTKADCNAVNKIFQNEAGLEAKDLTDGANQVLRTDVFFEPGTSGTTVSNSVVRGDRDVYVLAAQGGQEMTLSITSLEDNAVFDVVAPTGRILGTELTDETFYLESRGEYEIIVGGTRGNATYDLAITIE